MTGSALRRDDDGASGPISSDRDPVAHEEPSSFELPTLESTERMNQFLLRVNRDLDEFAYVVSHDLRAPLSGITTLTRWIREDNGDALDEKSREYLLQIEKRAERMEALLTGILQYSRVGRVDTEAEVVDVASVMREVIDALSPPAGIHITADGDLGSVMFHPVRFYQVLQNLIGNAVQHMGRPTGSITLSCRDAGEMWEYSVRDTGPGIEQQNLERVFKMFVTLGPKVESRSGIGLTIVRRAVEFYGGRITVRSDMGIGSDFRFTAPKAGAAVRAGFRQATGVSESTDQHPRGTS